MADTIISKNDKKDCLEFLEWVRENAEFEDFQKETFANGFMNLTNTLEFGSSGNQAQNENSNCNIQNVNRWAYLFNNWQPIMLGIAIALAFSIIVTMFENVIVKIALIIYDG
jgi:hypothetical protein